jgi:hypothetical protein
VEAARREGNEERVMRRREKFKVFILKREGNERE